MAANKGAMARTSSTICAKRPSSFASRSLGVSSGRNAAARSICSMKGCNGELLKKGEH
jgi:hypothetical protein